MFPSHPHQIAQTLHLVKYLLVQNLQTYKKQILASLLIRFLNCPSQRSGIILQTQTLLQGTCTSTLALYYLLASNIILTVYVVQALGSHLLWILPTFLGTRLEERRHQRFYHNIGDIMHYKYIFTRVEYDHSELHSLGTILDDDNEAAER